MEDVETTSVIEQFAINTNIPSIDASRANVTRYGTAEDELWTVTGNIVARNSYSALLDMAGGNDSLGVTGNVGASASGKVTLNAEYVGINGALTASTKGVTTINSDNIAINGVVMASGASSVNQLYTQNPGGQIALGMGLSAMNDGVNEIGVKYSGSVTGRQGLQVAIDGDMLADYGKNFIRFQQEDSGRDSGRIILNGNMEANYGGNFISLGSYGDNSVTIHGQMTSIGAGYQSGNWLTTNAPVGLAELNIEYGMHATEGGNNYVTWLGSQAEASVSRMQADAEGVNTLSIGGKEYAVLDLQDGMAASDYGKNYIHLGTHDFSGTTLSLYGGMTAENYGYNKITSSGDENTVQLYGDITYTGAGDPKEGYGYGNYVQMGSGDDHLIIDGHVSAKGLFMAGAAGYDQLTLCATDTQDMATRYQDWLESITPVRNANYPYWSSFESLQVELNGGFRNLDSLTWLETLVDRAEAQSGRTIDLELNIDHFGRNFTLNNFFTGRSDDIFEAVNMRGTTANTLRVSGDLSANAIDASTFKIHGDANDTVKVSTDWQRGEAITGGDGPDYVSYSNGSDTLLIQSEINVLFGV